MLHGICYFGFKSKHKERKKVANIYIVEGQLFDPNVLSYLLTTIQVSIILNIIMYKYLIIINIIIISFIYLFYNFYYLLKMILGLAFNFKSII